jgi:hypothetical protein
MGVSRSREEVSRRGECSFKRRVVPLSQDLCIPGVSVPLFRHAATTAIKIIGALSSWSINS